MFWKKITNSGKLLIKICKIPVVSKKILIRKIPDLGECRGVIYTCISGDYDRLIEHTYTDSEFKYVCFTDNKFIGGAGVVRFIKYTLCTLMNWIELKMPDGIKRTRMSCFRRCQKVFGLMLTEIF